MTSSWRCCGCGMREPLADMAAREVTPREDGRIPCLQGIEQCDGTMAIEVERPKVRCSSTPESDAAASKIATDVRATAWRTGRTVAHRRRHARRVGADWSLADDPTRSARTTLAYSIACVPAG